MKKQTQEQTQALARTIGKQIAKARRALGLTQDEASERIGITVEYYARLERGQSLPSLFTFLQISLALQVSTESLLSLGEITARAVTSAPPWFSAPQTDENKQLKRLFRRLRRVPPEMIAAVEAVLKQLERFIGKQRRKKARSSK